MPPKKLPFPPMEAELVDELPRGEWQYEPKWDGLSTGEPMVPPCLPSFLAANPFATVEAPAGKARLRRRSAAVRPIN